MDRQPARPLSASVEGARHLIQARRPELAERELTRWLALHPDDAHGHALPGWSLALQKRPGAVEAAEEAVRLAPEWAYTHAALGEVHMRLGNIRRAEVPLRRAIELAPDEPQHYALLAAALLDQRFRFNGREALRLAERGLAVDPGHATCARVRALALMQLFRFKRAREAAAFAQRLDPENSYGHAIAGWAHLSGLGTRSAGPGHLHEALRNDPENEFAQRGLWLANQWPVFAAAIVLETESGPWWLRAAVVPQAATVTAAVVRGGADAAGPLCVALGVLLGVEACTIPVRGTAERRARMAELRLPGALPPNERQHTRVLLMFTFAGTILLPLFVFLP